MKFLMKVLRKLVEKEYIIMKNKTKGNNDKGWENYN